MKKITNKSTKRILSGNRKKNYCLIDDYSLLSMRGIKARLNVDKLTICYTMPDEIYMTLKNGNIFDYKEFKLVRYKDPNKLFSDCFVIQCQNIDDQNGGLVWYDFAHIKFNMRLSENDAKYNYIWIYVDNRTLYTPSYLGVSVISELEYITDTLGFVINNITSLDIAFDSNINFARRIRKAVFNPSLKVILNGKLRNDPKEVLNEIIYLQKGNQERITDLAVYVSQKKKDGFKLCIYDKSKEAKVNDKSYILDWMKMSQNLYRVELRLKNQHLKEYFTSLNDFDLNQIYSHLCSQEFLSNIFLFFSMRLLRFRGPKKQVYSILDV